MLKSYLTSTIRDILKNKGYSAINIFGLAVALAACLLIFLFVKDELGYDVFIPNADRTYRLEVTTKVPNRLDETYSSFMGAYGPLIKERSSDVEDTTRYQTSRVSVGVGERLFYEDITFSDPNFLSFMGFNVPEGILDDQQALVLTRSIANKYFPNEDAVGKTMTLNATADYRVAYVIDDVPHKSHLAIDIVAPYHQVLHAGVNTEFMSMNNATYVRMKSGQSPAPIKELVNVLLDENVSARPSGAKSSTYRDTSYIKVQDVYLKSPAGVIGKPSGDINVVIGFTSVAILILIIATVNYINLATARAMKRAREVGIRKVMGATKKQLVTQFLGESIVITTIALMIALVVVELSLPVFNDVLGREIAFSFIDNPLNLVFLIILSILIGVIAGLYPAFYLSAFNPASVLKSDSGKASSIFLRQFLVFLQFTIAIALIAGTTVVVRQTLYASNMDLGFEKEGVLQIRNLRQNDLLDQVPLLDQQLLTVSGITHVSASQFVPTDPYDFTTGMYFSGEPDNRFSMSILSHQADFFDLYRLRLKAGRSLEKDRPSDIITEFTDEENPVRETNVLLNETAARVLGYPNPADIVNKQVIWPQRGDGETIQFNVVGVIEDFHLRSIHNTIRPMLYLNAPTFYRTLSIRYATDDFPFLISSLERKWAEIAPGVPLGYEVLSDQISGFYSSENRQMRVFVTFAVIAIIISAIGLLGLTAFTAERKTKEIGIRKVLGARTSDIIRLMVGQFSKPVLMANIIALPIAWWLMDGWLSDFEYRIQLDILWFISAGISALVIAWVTVISYSIKAAKANPIEALRYE